MKKLFIKTLFVFLLGPLSITGLFGQKFTVSGTIRDVTTGEELIGASTIVKELAGVGVVCNEYGFYSLTLKSGNYTLKTSFVGYNDAVNVLKLDKDIKLDIKLSSGKELEAVTVSAKKENQNVSKAQMGVEKLDISEIAKIPVLFGEKDILKTIQLLPGVKSAGEGNSGFYVRGGASDQNLILLDEAPVYNASHLLRFFSTFNSHAIKDVTLIKGNSSAQYGGRLASVLDVKMNEGNDKDYQVKGGIGLISRRLSVEGPRAKDTAYAYLPVFFDPADVQNNYLFFLYVNGKKDKGFGNVFNDNFINGVRNQRPIIGGQDFKVTSKDVITVEMQCIDKSAYDYFYSLDQITGNGNSATPANPVSNITGGALGYFSAHTVRKATAVIP